MFGHSSISVRCELTPVAAFACLLVVSLASQFVSGQVVIDSFAVIAESPDGEFGWDEFGLTGSPYDGPHAPDQFGSGSTIISSPGGLITSTNNLYSLFSVPQWTVNLNGLDDTESFTSLVVQFATSTQYDAGDFTLAGESPDEFIFLGEGPEIGGFPIYFYWAEWQGLDSASSLSIELQGSGQHQSLAAVKASYFNTTDPNYNISAVSEPVPGDANGDGVVTNDDILPFVQALTMPAAYAAAYPDVDPDVVLDMNGDGSFSNDDILGFVALLTGP